MEQRLNTLVDLIKIVLNFLVVICLESAMLAGVDEISDGYVRREYEALMIRGNVQYELILGIQLCMLAVLPFLYYFSRKYARQLILFLAVHPLGIVLIVWLADFFPAAFIWKAIYIIGGIFYAVISIKIRLSSSEDGEGQLPMSFAGVIAVVMVLICSYVGDNAGVSRIVWISFVWMLGHLVLSYLENYLHYVEMSRKTAGSLPEKNIFHSGMLVVGLFSAGTVLLLIACSQTSLIGMLTAIARKVGRAILYVIAWILVRLPKDSDEQVTAQQQGAGGEMDLSGLAEGTETFWLWEVLEKVLIVVMLAALVAGTIFLIYWVTKFLIREFYGRERKRKEIREEGFLEEEEPLRREKKNRNVKLPVLGGTPAQKIRRFFKKTVQESLRQRAGLSYQGLMRLNTAAQEDAGNRTTGKTARELSGDAAEWKKLTQLYEKARYSNAEADAEDAKEAGKLSREILHNIK